MVLFEMVSARYMSDTVLP